MPGARARWYAPSGPTEPLPTKSPLAASSAITFTPTTALPSDAFVILPVRCPTFSSEALIAPTICPAVTLTGAAADKVRASSQNSDASDGSDIVWKWIAYEPVASPASW